MKYFTVTVAVVACILAGTALAVGLNREGPTGPRGPQGQTGRDAEVAHLGLCVNIATQTGVLYLPVDTANPVTSPTLTDGVPSCPSGQFVSIVPGG